MLYGVELYLYFLYNCYKSESSLIDWSCDFCPLYFQVISPASQRNLCLAMSSREKYDDIDGFSKLFIHN